LITSSKNDGDIPWRMSRQAGANAFVALPTAPEYLLDTVRSLIAGADIDPLIRVAVAVGDTGDASAISRTFAEERFSVNVLRDSDAVVSGVASLRSDIVVSSDEVFLRLVEKLPDLTYVVVAAYADGESALDRLRRGAAVIVERSADHQMILAATIRAHRERRFLARRDGADRSVTEPRRVR
jgi:hypothetical protein